jgi:pyruvate-ferredoxin/flavodoxin oxidoreductase
MDGNEAAAYISYAFTEIASIYPITPSSTMAELVDKWSTEGKKNIFGHTVQVTEMQSEAGAAGTLHGALKTGVLATTYTASQGLLLMIPVMYKLAGEFLPAVFHVSSRALTTNALSIFGDHSDIMAVRQTGFILLAESSVQEVMDLSAVAHLAAIKLSMPVLNFFDGFRTSHELQKIETISYDTLATLLPKNELEQFREKSMNPSHPTVSGTNQNPDIHFQQRETINKKYMEIPKIVEYYMQQINSIRGTQYNLVDYYGANDAEEIIISMGSVSNTIQQVVKELNHFGRKVGHLNIHLYRPFPIQKIKEILPKNIKKIAVLDRSKEPGAVGESLLLDIKNTFYDSEKRPIIIGGRYGLGSKDVTPGQIVAVYNQLRLPKEKVKDNFTIGITDDMTYLSLPTQEVRDLTPISTYQAKFWGFGSDGTVSASKSTVKIIGNHTDKYVQGYFVYDSKKSGGLTTSHLRFGDEPIRSTYLIEHADFISCNTTAYVNKYDLLKELKPKGIFLLNTRWNTEELQRKLPQKLKTELIQKEAEFYTIDASGLANRLGLGNKINIIMQTTFFYLSKILPFEKASNYTKQSIEMNYRKATQEILERNIAAVDQTIANLNKITLSNYWTEKEQKEEQNIEDKHLPKFIYKIAQPIAKQQGDSLTVKDLIENKMTEGNIPLGTAAYEKRGIGLEVPEWIAEHCTMCNECAFVCPHAAIRPFLADDEEADGAPEGFITRKMKGQDGLNYRIQVSVEDCTGCGLCVEACPARNKALVMKPYDEMKEEAMNWAFSMTLKEKAVSSRRTSIKSSQFKKPLLEFSGACAGCGETPYVKLLTQLFGSRMMIANATGCSSIWGAASPISPYTTNSDGTGPAWSNSLFEDNAEFGYGMHLAMKKRRNDLTDELTELTTKSFISESSREVIEEWITQRDESEGTQQRAYKLSEVLELEKKSNPIVETLLNKKDLFVKPSQWIIGGDGWAYDIGYGGIDHVIASGEDINILVMDNEVYANTGGQTSKATPSAAIAKFSASGKSISKKDLGLMAMSYGDVYVAQISASANMMQTLKAFEEAEKFNGPSLIIAYTPCITQGIHGGMSQGLHSAKEAVESGYWSLYRYNPVLMNQGKLPMILDYKKPDFHRMIRFMEKQDRFSALLKVDEEKANLLFQKTVTDAQKRFFTYANLAGIEEKLRAKLTKKE